MYGDLEVSSTAQRGYEVDLVRGKVAIVTGGAQGIGHSACNLLAHEGAAVALTDALTLAASKLLKKLRRLAAEQSSGISTCAKKLK